MAFRVSLRHKSTALQYSFINMVKRFILLYIAKALVHFKLQTYILQKMSCEWNILRVPPVV